MMKRFLPFLLILFLVACGSADALDFTVEKAPTFKPDTPSEIIIKVKKDGEPLTGLELSGLLEMERMDHGIIEAKFVDQGDGTYSGEVELPMGGEWIIDLEAHNGADGETYEDVLTFDVNEG